MVDAASIATSADLQPSYDRIGGRRPRHARVRRGEASREGARNWDPRLGPPVTLPTWVLAERAWSPDQTASLLEISTTSRRWDLYVKVDIDLIILPLWMS